MDRFKNELEFAHINGFISGAERGKALDLVEIHPEELPRQLAFIEGINRLSLGL